MSQAHKTLYFLRHGIAVQRGSPGIPDTERPLTDQGREKMKQAARALAKLRPPIQALISSPLTRAYQTAEIVQKNQALEIEINPELSPGGSLENFLKTLKKRSENCLMLVGHEPDMSEWIKSLLEMGPSATLVLKKGGLACLSCYLEKPRPQAQLELLLSPKLLRKLA
ncbi:MAG: phosphohistidine phosphatase SixA [Deltaproteobacteria bacterium]|nr:phosphohistidine phosphatase SixA [Deltaproteobacteria bacterium]